MGYRGKLKEQEQARALRARSWTLQEIADELGVSKSSVSLWVRDVEFAPKPSKKNRNHGARGPRPHAQRERKLDEIAAMDDRGIQRIGVLGDRDLLIAGTALYAGEGAKRDGTVSFANTNPELMALFCTWLRRFFDIEERRLRAKLYLHQGLDLPAATDHWSKVTDIPPARFRTPYRAVPDAGIRTTKHVYGCATVYYCSATVHREVMGLVRGLPVAPISSPDRG